MKLLKLYIDNFQFSSCMQCKWAFYPSYGCMPLLQQFLAVWTMGWRKKDFDDCMVNWKWNFTNLLPTKKARWPMQLPTSKNWPGTWKTYSKLNFFSQQKILLASSLLCKTTYSIRSLNEASNVEFFSHHTVHVSTNYFGNCPSNKQFNYEKRSKLTLIFFFSSKLPDFFPCDMNLLIEYCLKKLF